MNAPSSPPPLPTPPDAAVAAPPLRLRPPAPLGHWHWLREGFQRKVSSGRDAAPVRMQPAPLFTLARPRRMRQAARSVLLWGLLFYALIQLAVFLVVYHWHPMLFEHVWYWKWRRFRRWAACEPDRPLLVMLGSSRTDDAFQARQLDGQPGPEGRPWRAYNFGLPATGPMHEWLYLRDMLDAGIRPRLLLIEYLPPLLNLPAPGLISEEDWTSAAWLRGTQLIQLWPFFADPIGKSQGWLESRLAPASVFRFYLQERLREWCKGEPPLPVLLSGHDPLGFHLAESPRQEARERRWIVNRQLYGHSFHHFRPWPGGIHAWHRLLKCCQREQIPVVLVVMPESPRFRALYTPACQITAANLLTEARNSGIPIIDANEWLAEDDFTDGHHTNARGSAKFTARLMDELKPLMR